MIEYAVRKHFPDLPETTGPRDYARNYLEKLIQVPFRIPALGETETRIYATLLLRSLDLEALAGRPIAEIFVGLADYICPAAGTVDEGIAREAYVETIIELTTEGLTDLSTFTPDQMQTVFELYATHAIEARICNDIGAKAVTMPADAQAAHRVEAQLRDFIRGGVSDALSQPGAVDRRGARHHLSV